MNGTATHLHRCEAIKKFIFSLTPYRLLFKGFSITWPSQSCDQYDWLSQRSHVSEPIQLTSNDEVVGDNLVTVLEVGFQHKTMKLSIHMELSIVSAHLCMWPEATGCSDCALIMISEFFFNIDLINIFSTIIGRKKSIIPSYVSAVPVLLDLLLLFRAVMEK